MKNLLRFMLFAAILLLGTYSANAQIGVGIRIGPPPPPRVVVAPPPAPGPDFFWVDGYWYPTHGHYRWHEGYWTRAPYAGAHWVGPGGLFYNGYWDGDRGRFEHRHEWDHDRERDLMTAIASTKSITTTATKSAADKPIYRRAAARGGNAFRGRFFQFFL